MKEKQKSLLVNAMLISMTIPLVVGIAYGVRQQIKETKAKQAIVEKVNN